MSILKDCSWIQTACPYCARDATELKQTEKTANVEELKVALKFDEGKPDLSQVTWELVEGLARVRMFGEKKYARDNWKKGFKVTRSLSAALRHIFKFLSGESVDSESGLSHLLHAMACLEHTIWDMKYHPENDDRYKRGDLS